MNDLSKRKVVEHNSLITSIAKIDKTTLKIFELAVSLIDIDNPLQDQTVYLSKQELFAFFKVYDNDNHSCFKEVIEKEQDKGFRFVSIMPIPYVEWTDYRDEVLIRFSPEIMPYLINLKTNFTKHDLSDISQLNSKYAVILYLWLSMNYDQYEHYDIKGGRRERGTLFENLLLSYLKNEPTYKALSQNAWVLADVPDNYGISKKDTGVDLVAEQKNGDLVAIQAKFYTHKVGKDSINSFVAELGKSYYQHGLIISTVDEWNSNARETIEQNEKGIEIIGLSDLRNSQINWSQFIFERPEKVTIKKPKKLRS